MIARVIVAMAVAGGVAGCAAENTPMAAVPAATAPAAVATAAPVANAAADGPVDGVYRGPMTMLRNAGGQCTSPRDVTLRVRDRTVTSSFGTLIRLEAKVQPDGTFTTQSGRTGMTGTVRGGRLEADIGNEYCAYHYALTRS